MKILILVSEFPPGPGGIGMHAFSMAKALLKKEHDITVIASGDYVSNDEINDFDRQQPFPVIRFKRNIPIERIRRFLLVNNYIKKHKIKKIIVSGKFSLWIALGLQLTRRKLHIIGILHGSEVNLPSKLQRLFTHISIFSCNKLVAVSKFTRNLLPAWILKRKDITVVPNGIDICNMPIVDSSVLLQGNPRLLTVGNVTPRKGQQRVIKALPSLVKAYPNVHYHVVGLPTFKQQFYDLACKLGVERHVTFHGRVNTFDELASLYISSDVFLLLSENQSDGDVEGFGIVVLEAGYYGLPTVGAKNCGIADAICENYNGYLVDGDDKNRIVEAVGKCMKNNESLSRQSNLWSQRHSWDKIIEQIIDLM